MRSVPTLIADRYEVTRLLGRGGMGEVHLARDARLGRDVALKCISQSKDLTPKRRQRQEREARAIAALAHPSIAQIYDVVTHDDRDWLVLEFVEGHTLSELLATGPLPIDRTVRLAIQVAEALAHAHDAGILHRDLKADNVMVSPGDRVRLLDFGLAKIRDDDESLTEDGVVVGTLSSVSPEQAEGRTVDQRSDLFSFGTLLYQMLTGRHPFKSDTATATLNNVVRLEPRALRSLNTAVPAELAELVHKLLAKDPTRRPSSATEVLAMLHRHADNDSVTRTGSMSAVQASLAHGVRRRRVALRNGGIVAAAIAVIVAAALLGRIWKSQPPEPLFVAVAKPTLALAVDGRDEGPVAEAVRIAATNTLADLDAVYPSELESDTLEARGLASALQVAGATEAFTAELTPSAPGVWSIQLRRRAEPGNQVLWTDTLTVLEDQPDLVREAIRQAVVEGWSERPLVEGSSLDEVRPEDFRRYVDLLARSEPVPTKDQVESKLDELQSIRGSSPRFLDAYATEVETCRYSYMLFWKTSYLDRAREVLTEMQRQDSEDMRTLVAGARIAELDRDAEALEQLLDVARSVAPAHPQTLEIAATKAMTEGDPERAVEIRHQMVLLHPSAENIAELAAYQRIAGRTEQALESLERVLVVDPTHSGALVEKANILTVTDPRSAAEIYAQLLESGDRFEVEANWATTFLVTGQVTHALEIYRRAIEAGHWHPVNLLGLADCHKALGDTRQADIWYQQVIDAVAPQRETAPIDLLGFEVQALAHLGHLTEARRLLDEMTELEPNNPATIYPAALVATFEGDFERARAHRKRWNDAASNDVWFHFPWFDPMQWEPDTE
jgi:tRNA A-37 threonylcarbamoyl transferase component Bud32/tetratricopeptide (TPR) repeat protein